MRATLAMFVVGILAVAAPANSVLFAADEKIETKDLPKGSLDAVKKLFPDAEVVGAAKEKDGEKTVYEVELKSKGKTIDVMLSVDGKVETIERQIDDKDLPAAISKAVKAKYAKGVWKKVEAVSQVKEGKEKLDFYELLIGLADEKTVEIKVATDGKITEEAADADEGAEEKDK